MGKNCVASFYVQLSSAATAIPLPENDLISLVRAFRYFDRTTASEILFQLKYGTLNTKMEGLNYFAQKSSKKGEFLCSPNNFLQMFANFTDEDFVSLANELQLQYIASDPGFLDIHSIRGLPNSCQKELNALQAKMENDLLLFFMAVKNCVKNKKNSKVSQWILQLLSNNPASQTVGLSNLGFNFNYRVCLKPFASEIGALLLAIRQIYVKRQSLLNCQDNLALPIIALLQKVIDLDVEIYKHTNPNSSMQKYHHSDIVSTFEENVLHFLQNSISNFEPNILEQYSEKLQKLGNSIYSLLYSQFEYRKIFPSESSEGILYFAATDISLVKQMCDIQARCSTTKLMYETSLRDFNEFLIEHFQIS